MNWRPDVCVFHGGCDDGVGAAFAVWRRWGDEVQFVPAGYGKPLACDVRGKNVLMVDFSFKRPQMEELDRIVGSMVVLDHHKTAEAELAPWTAKDWNMANAQRDVGIWIAQLLNTTATIAHFDMHKSGARLAWEFCFPGEPIPALIEHIEDRDLWRFRLPDTERVSAALRTYVQDFAVWDRLDVPTLIAEGTIVLRGHKKNVQQHCEQAYEERVGGFWVPVVNVPYHYASDCAHELLGRFPQAPFCGAWFRRGDGQVQWSLRSENSRHDVSEIATLYGGGGHRNAAGFQAPAGVALRGLGPA
jgi:uncharacterized protein